MCGIGGVVLPGRGEVSAAVLAGMREAMRERGPDDHGVWTAPGVGLVHTRLSIIDLSPAGAQPMVSASGRYVITYNGEIYNAQDFAPELVARGVTFRGHSDTEVLVEAIDAWGLEATLRRINGMFAFSVWDREAVSYTHLTLPTN